MLSGLARRRRLLVLAGLAVTLGWPALQPHPSDGFPVSSYPMFARDRGRIVVLATAVGRSPDGTEHRLGPHAIGGGDEVMLAASAARKAVVGGRADAQRFCEEVADRVAAGAGPDGLTGVEVRTEERDAVADPRAEAAARAVVVHAECAVP